MLVQRFDKNGFFLFVQFNNTVKPLNIEHWTVKKNREARAPCLIVLPALTRTPSENFNAPFFRWLTIDDDVRTLMTVDEQQHHMHHHGGNKHKPGRITAAVINRSGSRLEWEDIIPCISIPYPRSQKPSFSSTSKRTEQTVLVVLCKLVVAGFLTIRLRCCPPR